LVRTITGLDPGLEGERDVALQPRHVEILVAGGDDEDRVDVRRDQLHLAARARRAALDQALALQHAARPGPRAIEQQPVAHRGVRSRRDGLVDPVARHLQSAAMHGDDAHRGRRGQRIGVDLPREGRAPAEAFQRRGLAARGCGARQEGGVVADHRPTRARGRRRRRRSGRGRERRQRRVGQGLRDPALRLPERLRRGQVGLRDGLEPHAAVEGRIAIGHGDVHALLPERIEAVGDQPLPDPLALMRRRHRHGGHHEDRARIALVGEAREEDAAEERAVLPGGEHAQILGGRLRDQPAREGADQRAFLRALRGGEGRREELRNRLGVGGVIR
jgi:hypothetical protein